ncbi:MAG: methyl-accepting chemotaxis sensory transducer, partial [Herbinix sp.]|nr:methyl-accepting chemotaxis sensory transducer [Herbinix sp.]
MKSLKTKLVLFSTLLVLAVTLIIGIIAISIGRGAIEEEAEYSVLLLAAESARLTESRMDAMVSTLTMISKKAEIANMGWEVNLELLSEELAKTDFIDIGYILPNGYTYYTDGTVRLMSDRTYVKNALSGTSKVSEVIISRVTRKPEIEAAVPVYLDGAVIGAMIARMEADYLSEITNDIGYGEKGYAFMMNGSGTIIAHPDAQKVIERYNPAVEGDINTFQKILQNKTGVISYQEGEEILYAGYAPIAGTDWCFIVTANQQEVMASIPKMLRTIVIAMLLVFAGSLVVVYLVERRITKPLIELTKHSKRIGKLDISENIDVNYLGQRDEIGTLSGAFQNLTLKLRDTITAISDSANRVSDTALRLTATSQQSSLVADEISRTVEDIAKGAMEQANHTE